MDADADDIARLDGREVDTFERLIDQPGIAPTRAGRGREDVQPARRDDGHAERLIAGID